jgi:hypothetical protein
MLEGKQLSKPGERMLSAAGPSNEENHALVILHTALVGRSRR